MRQQEQQSESPAEHRERRARRRAREPATGAGATPLPVLRPTLGRLGPTEQPRAPASASSVSETVSTMASWSSPLSRVATIWVVMTRNPPPKMYGALNEASDVMNVSSAAPAERRIEQRQHHAPERAPAARAQARRRLVDRGVERRRARPG